MIQGGPQVISHLFQQMEHFRVVVIHIGRDALKPFLMVFKASPTVVSFFWYISVLSSCWFIFFSNFSEGKSQAEAAWVFFSASPFGKWFWRLPLLPPWFS
jgi:hypothetical protein